MAKTRSSSRKRGVDLEKALRRFEAATQLHRHESTLLFGQVSVYLAGMGALTLAALSKGGPGALVGAGVFGACLGMAYLVITKRVTRHMADACEAAEQLEEKALGSAKLYRRREKATLCGKWAAQAIVVIVLVGSAVMALVGLAICTGLQVSFGSGV